MCSSPYNLYMYLALSYLCAISTCSCCKEARALYLSHSPSLTLCCAGGAESKVDMYRSRPHMDVRARSRAADTRRASSEAFHVEHPQATTDRASGVHESVPMQQIQNNVVDARNMVPPIGLRWRGHVQRGGRRATHSTPAKRDPGVIWWRTLWRAGVASRRALGTSQACSRRGGNHVP